MGCLGKSRDRGTVSRRTVRDVVIRDMEPEQGSACRASRVAQNTHTGTRVSDIKEGGRRHWTSSRSPLSCSMWERDFQSPGLPGGEWSSQSQGREAGVRQGTNFEHES